ncbi:MAG: hypothetical protein K5770_12075 [Lachnospiraceae bacterium]|nr:hypothetical protein [Lachnospiraceae bacterium]
MGYKEQIINMSIEYLIDSPIGEEIRKIFEHIEKNQEVLYGLNNSEDDKELKILRIGTVLSLVICGKMFSGKNLKSFTEDDWKDVADKVAEYGILADGRDYTVFVFNLYSEYIDLSVKIRESEIEEEHRKDIIKLSEELKYRTGQFQRDEINEADYVDECLWISFDAMIKLLVSYKTAKLSKKYGDLIVAASDLAVQFGRFKLYEKENALLDEYIRNQYQLTEELETKFKEYIKELEVQTGQIDKAIEEAFSGDFQNTLRNTVKLAKVTGVRNDKILDSVDKVDAFFVS